MQGDYRDVSLFSAQLLPNNEILVLQPSISAKWLDEQSYSQMIQHANQLDVGYSQVINAQTIMRSMYLRNGNEHMRVRTMVFRFPDDYQVSNEIFSTDAFINADPRSKLYMWPCNIVYMHSGLPVSESFFHADWRFNKRMTAPQLTSVTRNHQDVSVSDLELSFQRSMNTNL